MRRGDLPEPLWQPTSNRFATDSGSRILAIDQGGYPLAWFSWKQAVNLYVRERVIWDAGNARITINGGRNRLTGLRSAVGINSIIALRGRRAVRAASWAPPLTNRELFLRDLCTCLYCGQRLSPHRLSRDHVTPLSTGGRDQWTNVVTACKECNQRKGGRTPEGAGMELLAIPFAPSRGEHLILCNRRILADQMDFLIRHVPRGRRERYWRAV